LKASGAKRDRLLGKKRKNLYFETMTNVRIKEVAKHAGVSEPTVTRVVNNSGYVSRETRRRVLDSIEKLQYIPNRMASALKNRKTGIISHVIPLSLENHFFAHITAALNDAVSQYNYHILPMYHNFVPRHEDKFIREALSQIAEGFIFTSNVLTNPKIIEEIIAKGLPVIMIERPLPLKGIDRILLDDINGSVMAVEKFFSLGHRDIGFIGRVPSNDLVECARYDGYKTALEKYGLELNRKSVVFTGNHTRDEGYAAMKTIIENNRTGSPSACYIISDLMVCGALQYLYEKNLRVPEDISVIGYDNSQAEFCSPPITSVAVPFDEIGKTAISLFIERREQKRVTDKTVTLSLSIVDRGSVLDLRERIEGAAGNALANQRLL
jgi:LacI family transcriptional regulator